MPAPTSLTLELDDGLGVVVMHDGSDIGGQYVVFTLTDEDQPLNHSRLQTGANKFTWPESLYAGTIKLQMDYNEPGVTTTLFAELELLHDVNYNSLPGDYEPDPPAATAPTGVTPGAPGSFTPAGSTVPANLAALEALGPLGQTAAWTETHYVDLTDASTAHWNGTAWAVGPAGPAADDPDSDYDPDEHVHLPDTNWRKGGIQEWLDEHEVAWDDDMTKADLLELVRDHLR